MSAIAHYKDVPQLISNLHEDETVNCLCPQVLMRHVDFFKTAFPGTVAYAVKANPAPPLLAAMSEAGIHHFDVASVTEIALLRSIQSDAVLFYDNPVKSRKEITLAYLDYGVRNFAIDDAIELEKIHDIIGADESVELCVRFGSEGSTAVYDLGTKFGADETTAVALLEQISALGYQSALTFHPGSQCLQADAYNGPIAAAARIEKQAGVNISMLNVGGGFPTAYPNSHAPRLSAIFKQIGDSFAQHFAHRDVLLVCEPGRALADPAVSTLTRVKHRRVEPVVFLNNGIYGDFMEQLLAHVEMPTRVYRDGELLQGKSESFKVFGPTCDSLDVFSYDVPLPGNIREGDWIEFAENGGYGSSCRTNFNGYSGGDYVLIDEGFETDAFLANLSD